MEAKEEIYQYIRKHIKEDGVTAQSIAEIFGRNIGESSSFIRNYL